MFKYGHSDFSRNLLFVRAIRIPGAVDVFVYSILQKTRDYTLNGEKTLYASCFVKNSPNKNEMSPGAE